MSEAVVHTSSRRNTDEADLFRAVMETRDTLGELAITVGRLAEKVEHITNLLTSQANLPERVTRLETRLDEAEKQMRAYQWLVGVAAAVMCSLLAIAAGHVNWR